MMSYFAYSVLGRYRGGESFMRVEDFLINGLKNDRNSQQAGALGENQNNGSQVMGTNVGGLGVDCCPTNNVLGTNIGGLGVDCCPTGNQVLGVTAGRQIEVPEVLGISEGQTIVEVCIPVVPQGITILFDQIDRRLVFDALVASNNKVFVNGRLIKTIPYQVCNRAVTPVAGNISRIVLSEIRAITIEVPFALCINVPGSVKGARAVVLDSSVDSVELPNLRCPNQPCIVSIVEKDCIRVRVKAEMDTIITVPTA